QAFQPVFEPVHRLESLCHSAVPFCHFLFLIVRILVPRRSPFLLLAGMILLSGCTTARKQAAAPVPVPLPAATPPKPATRSLPPPVIPEEPAHKTAPPLPDPAEQPHVRETPASSVRKLLPKTCVVMEVTPTTLLVKSGAPTESSSLFEEAIALSKLRGILTAKPAIPKDTSQKTKLQNGTATIPFGKSVSPSDAATAVVAAFSVDGVQRVRAVLNAN
ncbi:MAG: hypothetical protein WCH98_21200, partial [Verrucomicrobiota bacterium]